MICTLRTPFQAEGTAKIHTERFFKFPSIIYSILYVDTHIYTPFIRFSIMLIKNQQATSYLTNHNKDIFKIDTES